MMGPIHTSCNNVSINCLLILILIYEIHLVITLREVFIQGPDGFGVLDNVEDGGDDGEDELDHPDDDDGLLEGEPEHRGKAGTVPAHDGQVSSRVIC